jgi:hypothetical protein
MEQEWFDSTKPDISIMDFMKISNFPFFYNQHNGIK